MELVLRFDYGSIVPWVRNVDGMLIAVAGPDLVTLRTPVELVGPQPPHVRLVHRWRRRPSAVRPDVVALDTRARREPVEAEAVARRHRLVLGGVVEALRGGAPVGRGGSAVPDHPQGAHVRADRRDRGCADDVAPRGARWRPELGLPLLLAPRRHADAARVHSRRVHGGGGAHGATGSCVRSPDPPTTSRSCTAWPASGGWSSSSCRGSTGTSPRGPVRIGNGAVGSAPARRLRRGHRRPLPRSEAGPRAVRRRVGARAQDSRLARVRVAAAGRGDLGGARPAAALHALEDHGVGRVRPCREDGAAPRSRGTDRPLARVPAGDSEGDPRVGLQPGARLLRPVLRLGPARREPAPHPARRFPPGGRPTCRRHRRRHRARPDARRPRRAVPRGRGERRRRRAAAGRGRLPPVLVLARRGPALSRDGSTRRSSSSSGCSRSGTTSACSRRSTTPSASGSSATSRRRSPTSRSSRRRSRSRGSSDRRRKPAAPALA